MRGEKYLAEKMEVSLELIWSTIAILLTVWGYAPYLIGIYKGTIQPHYFSWLIWGLTTCIVFLPNFLKTEVWVLIPRESPASSL